MLQFLCYTPDVVDFLYDGYRADAIESTLRIRADDNRRIIDGQTGNIIYCTQTCIVG